jgi:hypothetical protein
MKRLFVLILTLCMLLSATACSDKESSPFSVNVLYDTDRYTSCFLYSFVTGTYVDVGAPEFMGIALWMDYEEDFLVLNPDGSMKYQKKPFKSIEGTVLETEIPTDEQEQLIQSMLQMDPSPLEGWDQDSISVLHARKTEGGMPIVFSDILTTSCIHIAEFDTEGNLMRLIEVEGLRYTHLDHCEIRDLTLPKE